MNPNILSDYLTQINYQIAAQETLLGYHFKAEAMLKVLLESDSSHYSKAVIHDSSYPRLLVGFK